MVELTVAVCTYNRSEYLHRCLASLSAQASATNPFEVIVVDNASTDSTKDVISRWCEMDSRFRYVVEPVQGLARARNTALALSKAPVIAFTDDDAVVPENWVKRYLEAFASQPDNVAVIGGEIDPVFETARPDWLTDELLRPLSVSLKWSDRPRLLKGDEWLCEVNSAYRIEPLRRYGGFPEELGRRGDLLLSGENFVNKAMRHDGLKEFFDPTIRVKHHIDGSRLTKEWFRRRFFWQGVTGAKIPDIARSAYGQHVDYWQQINVPTSPAEWFNLFSDDADSEDFLSVCGKISEIGYLLASIKLISGR